MKFLRCRDFVDQYLLLCRVGKKLDVEFRETLGISYNDYLVLALAAGTVCTQKQISDLAVLSQAAISKIVFRMSEAKLVSLADHGDDRRSNIIELTDLGKKKLHLAANLADEIVNNYIN